MRTGTFIECHLPAFEHFGGWTRTILYDNLKSVVLKRALLSSEPEFNEMYLDFAKHHGITLNIRGESYRMRARKAAGTAFPPPARAGGSTEIK